MNAIDVVVLSFLGSALLIGGLAVPLALRKIGPNQWYGFRTRKNLADEELWYETNALSAFWLIAAAIMTALVIGAGWMAELNVGELSIAGTAALIPGCLLSAIHPLIVQRRILAERENEDDQRIGPTTHGENSSSPMP